MKTNLKITIIIFILAVAAGCMPKANTMPAPTTTPATESTEDEIVLELPEETNPLFISAAEGNLAKLQQLIAAGADLKEKNYLGKNALHIAAEANQLAIVKFLIESDMDIKASDNNTGATALHSAAANGNLEMVTYLLQNGADINAIDVDGYTPLDAAEGQKVIDYLVSKGAKNGPGEAEY